MSIRTSILSNIWQHMPALKWRDSLQVRPFKRKMRTNQTRCVEGVATHRRREYRLCECNQIDACRAKNTYGFPRTLPSLQFPVYVTRQYKSFLWGFAEEYRDSYYFPVIPSRRSSDGIFESRTDRHSWMSMCNTWISFDL